jgi:hypothetical protein
VDRPLGLVDVQDVLASILLGLVGLGLLRSQASRFSAPSPDEAGVVRVSAVATPLPAASMSPCVLHELFEDPGDRHRTS